MAKKKQLYYKSPYGVWLTDHDIKNYTPPGEKQAYRIFSLVMAVLAVVFLAIGIIGVDSIMTNWVWIALGLACLGYLMSVGVAARRKDRTTLQSFERELHPAIDPERIEGFWFERDVKDTTNDQMFERSEIREGTEGRP